MAGTSKLPSLLEVDALKEEQLRAAREGRSPKWDNLTEVMEENIAEELLIWGSKGQQLQTKEGRYTTKQHSAKTDELLGVKTLEGSPNTPQSTFDEAKKAEAELLEAQAKANAELSPQLLPKVELVTSDSDKKVEDTQAVPTKKTVAKK